MSPIPFDRIPELISDFVIPEESPHYPTFNNLTNPLTPRPPLHSGPRNTNPCVVHSFKRCISDVISNYCVSGTQSHRYLNSIENSFVAFKSNSSRILPSFTKFGVISSRVEQPKTQQEESVNSANLHANAMAVAEDEQAALGMSDDTSEHEPSSSTSNLGAPSDTDDDCYQNVQVRHANDTEDSEEDEALLGELDTERFDSASDPTEWNRYDVKDTTELQWLIEQADGRTCVIRNEQILWVGGQAPPQMIPEISGECLEAAESAYPFLHVAWKLHVDHLLHEHKRHKICSVVPSGSSEHLFTAIQHFFFHSCGKIPKFGGLTTFLLLRRPNPYFELHRTKRNEWECSFKVVSLHDLGAAARNKVKGWSSELESRTHDVMHTGSTEPLRAMFGEKTYARFESALKTIGNFWDGSHGVNELPKGFSDLMYETHPFPRIICSSRVDSRAWLLSSAIVKIVCGAGLLPLSAFQTLVRLGIYHRHVNVPLAEYEGISSNDFPPEVLARADFLVGRARRESHTTERTLFLDSVSFAIDSADTVEVDDAIGCGCAENEIVVHIADVARLFTESTFRDPVVQEAIRRRNTMYFPERNKFMLPPAIVSETSLGQDGETCMAITVTIREGAVGSSPRGDGEESMQAVSVCRSRIRTPVRLTYEQFDEILKDTTHEHHSEAKRLFERSELVTWNKYGSYPDRPQFIVTNAQCDMPDISVTMNFQGNTSNRMVEKIMVAANVAFGKFGSIHGLTMPYRLTNRRLKVRVDFEPGYHHYLGVPQYSQVTSPMRRSTDLLAQIAITNFMLVGEKGSYKDYEEFRRYGTRHPWQGKAEERVHTYWQLEYIRQRGPDFVHLGVIDSQYGLGTAVILLESGFPIPIHSSRIEAEIGDAVEVKFTMVDPRSVQWSNVFEKVTKRKDIDAVFPGGLRVPYTCKR